MASLLRDTDFLGIFSDMALASGLFHLRTLPHYPYHTNVSHVFYAYTSTMKPSSRQNDQKNLTPKVSLTTRTLSIPTTQKHTCLLGCSSFHDFSITVTPPDRIFS